MKFLKRLLARLTARQTPLESTVYKLDSGAEVWFRDGKIHRVGDPAITQESFQAWYIDGKLHRTDGPAVVRKNEASEWWVQGVMLTEDEFYRFVDQDSGEVLIPLNVIIRRRMNSGLIIDNVPQ